MFKDDEDLVLMNSRATNINHHSIEIRVTSLGHVSFIAKKDNVDNFVNITLSEDQAKALGRKLIEASMLRSDPKFKFQDDLKLPTFPPGKR